MTFKALVLHVGTEDADRARLEAAVSLAARFQADLIGVGAETLPYAYASPEAAFIQGAALAEHRARIEESFEEARSLLVEATRGRVSAVDWRTSIDFPAKAVAREARAADLVVASAPGATGLDPYRRASAAELVMDAGRPVLVAPSEARPFDGRSVVIGWNDTREARRAVADALPFLETAERVAVVEICGDAEQDTAFARTSDVARALGRRGVEAHADARLGSGSGTAADLLRAADEHGAGLLVIGAYGHSRLREWIFGGVTLDVLRRADRFVLMSH